MVFIPPNQNQCDMDHAKPIIALDSAILSAELGLCCGGATVGSVSSSLLVSSDLCRLLCLHKDKVCVGLTPADINQG
jgi:hypothetical protein